MLKRALEQPELFAEFTGILLGDGSISRYRCRSPNGIKIQNRLKVTLDSREKEYIIHICEVIKSLFSIEPLVRFRNGENTVDIMLFNKVLVAELENFGFVLSPKWNRAIIPPFFLKKNLGKHILRGYFDTDGVLAIVNNNGMRYPRIEMKIMPSPMQQQFIQLLKEQNFRFGVYMIGKGEVRVQINGVKQVNQWMKSVGMMNVKQSRKLNEINLNSKSPNHLCL